MPLEWQVERYEKVVNKKHDEYLKKLEIEVKEAKRRKAEEEKYKQVWSLFKLLLGVCVQPNVTTQS